MDFALDLVTGNTFKERQRRLRVRVNPFSLICLGNLLASDQFNLHPILNRTLKTMFLDECLFLLIKLDHFGFIRRCPMKTHFTVSL